MSIRNLDSLFQPKSIAVFGATEETGSPAVTVMRNLRATGFPGPVMPVGPGASAVVGSIAYPDAAHLPTPADLAVICTPVEEVPPLIDELGRRGTRAAIVISGHRLFPQDEAARGLRTAMLEAARPHLLRILGPASIGLMAPHIGVSAGNTHSVPIAGKIGFITQSRALAAAVLDHANTAGVGFSYFVSLGAAIDVDLGDVLDYLASDANTRAVLIHAESIDHARKFMSSARAAARSKPVLMVKAGRAVDTGRDGPVVEELAGISDLVADAAIRRAGVLRVDTIAELFDAVETLTFVQRLHGDRLATITNGGGPGVMAADALAIGGGTPATLSDKTRRALETVIGLERSQRNPVDIGGDATPGQYGDTLAAVLDDQGVDAALLIHAPNAGVDDGEVATAAARTVENRKKPVFACWLGKGRTSPARQSLSEAGIPNYDSPEDAVRAFAHVANYWKNQEILMQTPASVADEFVPDVEHAQSIIRAALAAGHDRLTVREVTQVFRAYAIPVVDKLTADTPDEAARFGEALGFPVAVKILSPDIAHGSDIGGLALDLGSSEDVRRAAAAMLQRLKDLRPDARVEGFHVQEMVRRPEAIELIAGAFTDPVFGPVVLFGHGGAASEVIADRAIGLPPLNMALAKELVGRTRVARLLAGYRGRDPAYMTDIHLTLVKVAHLMASIPMVRAVEINPLLGDSRGVLAVNADLWVAPSDAVGAAHLSIKPYPKELEERTTIDGRPILLRPIRPEDEPEHRVLLDRVSPDDLRFRFFAVMRQFGHAELVRFTQIDYDREMAFIASSLEKHGERETLGVVRAISDPDNERAEFAILVRSDLKGKGLGRILMDKLIRYCRRAGLAELTGQILADNHLMRRLAERTGFTVKASGETDVLEISLPLRE